MVGALLAVAAPSMAQPTPGGTADPLGLIASGAVIPYVGQGLLLDRTPGSGIATVNSLTGAFGPLLQGSVGSLAILDVASPVGNNDGLHGNSTREFHMYFFDQSCLRVGPSIGNPLTVNDADLLNLNLIGNIPAAGLIAAAAVDNRFGVGDVLEPLDNPVHMRVHWINVSSGVLSRVLEPISILNPETGNNLTATYNPLRTGATFLAPFEGSGVRTTLYLVCPTQNIIPGVFPDNSPQPYTATTTTQISQQSVTIPVNSTIPFAASGIAYLQPGNDIFAYTGVNATNNAFTGVSGIGRGYASATLITPLPVGGVFPPLNPRPVPGTGATPLFMRIFDDEEQFRRNVDIFCRCWGAHPLAAIDQIFSNPDPIVGAPNGTYTEVEGEPSCGSAEECSFTGYRSIQWGSGQVGNDVFGRLSNGSFPSIRGPGVTSIR
jgi:hypothetical protein